MAVAKEKDYVKIAERRIVKPSQLKSRRKLLVYSRNKKGKTYFAASAGVEKVLFIDPEHGTDTMVALDPNVWHVDRWEDMQEAYGYLRTGDHPYEWVAVDGLTRINNMALRYVMKVAEERDLDRRPGMVDRRDYNKSGELMKQMLTNFQNLKMGVIYTAQERIMSQGSDDEEEGESSVYYVPDLPASVRGYVNSVVDVIGRLYLTRTAVKVKGGGTKDVMQRRLWIGPHEKFDTGYRSDFVLPDYVKNPTIPKLVDLMMQGQVTP